MSARSTVIFKLPRGKKSLHKNKSAIKRTMSKNIIFLDVDGPLVSPLNIIARNYANQTRYKFHGLAKEFIKTSQDNPAWVSDPSAVILITYLAQETNAKIVISSTWRQHGYKLFSKEFKELGFDHALLHKDWRTTTESLRNREDEIQLWLDRNPDIEKFVTIDDELLDFDTHIQVCAVNGFLFDNYIQAYEALTNEKHPNLNLYAQASVHYNAPNAIVEGNQRLKRSARRLKERHKQKLP